MKEWDVVIPSIWRNKKSPFCYLLETTEGYLLINPGGINDHSLSSIPRQIKAVILTDAISHHSEGIVDLKKKLGFELYAPESEEINLSNAETYYAARPTFHQFDTYLDYDLTTVSLPVDFFVADYGSLDLCGLKFHVVPTPGASYGAISILVEIENKKIVFTGELLFSGAKVRRIRPLQYIYNDARGLICTYSSVRQLENLNPDIVCPSFGPVVENPEREFSSLRSKIRDYFLFLEGNTSSIDKACGWDIKQIIPGLFYVSNTEARTYLIKSEQNELIALDSGNLIHSFPPPGGPYEGRKRAFLPDMLQIRKATGCDRISSVLVTHYHDDHISGLNHFVRLFGTEVLAGENFSEVLEGPEAFDLQCLQKTPISTSPLQLNVWHNIKGIEILLKTISGHTKFGTLVFLKIGDKKIAHIGDAFFFFGEDGFNYGKGVHLFTNHVYANGLEESSYEKLYQDLSEFRPNLILTGHSDPYEPDEELYELLRKQAEKFKEVHHNLLPLDNSLLSGGFEGRILKIHPFRVNLAQPSTFSVTLEVSNPNRIERTIVFYILNLPDAWNASDLEVTIPPKGSVKCTFEIEPATFANCHQLPLQLGGKDVDGVRLGVLGHFLVTICEKPRKALIS